MTAGRFLWTVAGATALVLAISALTALWVMWLTYEALAFVGVVDGSSFYVGPARSVLESLGG